MAGVQISDPRAPWIMFERRAVEDRDATIKAGRYMAKDVDFVLVTPHGSKDQIEAEVQDWFTRNRQQVQEGRLPHDWQLAYERAYDNWKAGKELPLDGTPILNWPVVSPSQIRLLQDIHILTVETLAVANEEAIRRLGMGGRALVDKAKDWLKQAEGPGKVVEEIGQLKVLASILSEQNRQLAETNALLMAQLQQRSPDPAAANPAPAPLDQGPTLSDIIDPPNLGTRL
jgi:hypothetical protein